MLRRITTLVVAVAVIAVAAVGWKLIDRFTGTEVIEFEEESRDSRLIHSIEREEQIVLLSLGIQGISEKTQTASFKAFGIPIPGADRALFMRYEFDAKLGLDASYVVIEEIAEDHIHITLPDYIFIGHNNEEFELVTEKNGVLSFVTPEISQTDMVNEVLSNAAKRKYINGNRAILNDQAQMFYTTIVHAIDPDVTVTFTFPGIGKIGG